MLKTNSSFDSLKKSSFLFGILLLSIGVFATPADPTTTALVASSNTSVLSSPVILTATVSPSTVTGKVTFYAGADFIGTASVTGGVASYVTTTLPVGELQLKAYYRGPGPDAPSTSNVVPHTVQAGVGNGFHSIASSLSGYPPQGVALADLDNDGKLDLISINDFKQINLMRGDGAGAFLPGWSPLNFSFPPTYVRDVVAADLDNDGNIDLISSFGGVISGINIHYGDGNGGFGFPALLSFGGMLQGRGIAVADFNNDGNPDIIASDGSSVLYISLGNGDRVFPSPGFLNVSNPVSSLATGDVDLDGNVDLIVGSQTNIISIFFGVGDGTFSASLTFPVGMNPTGIATRDMNGDGYPDIVTANNLAHTITVLLNNQDKTFTSSDHPAGLSPFTPLISDFNGDGHMDVIVSNSTSTVSVLHGNGDGTFNYMISYPTTPTGGPTFMATGDLNGDGVADVVVSESVVNNVGVLLGVSIQSLTVMGGTPQSTAVNTSFADQFRVMVLDSNDNPVDGVMVTFSAPGSGPSGTFASSATVFTHCGVATAPVFTANNIGGTYNVTASVVGNVQPAIFSLTNTGGVINQIGFTQQPTSTQIGAVITPAITVQLRNGSGSPLATPGVPVTLMLSSGSGPLTGTTTVNTNASGVSVFSDLTIGSAGSKTLTASSPGLASVPGQSFLVVNPGGGSLTPTAGTNQSTHPGAIFPVPLQVRLLNSAGMPAADTPVTYTVPHSGAGGAFTHSATVLTDINGIATAPDLVANHIPGSFEVRVSASGVSLPAVFMLTNLAASPESPRIAGVVNAGSFLRVISAGSLATIFGDGFSPVPLKAEGFPLPMELGGISITVEGLPAPLLYVDEKQINFQLPDLTSLGDLTSVVVTVHRKGMGTYTQVLPIRLTSPGIFMIGETKRAVAQNQDFSLNSESNPVAPGGIVFLYATGLGPVNPPVQAGNAAPLEVLSWTTEEVTATIGNQPAKVLFSGLTPGFAGLMQVNIQIPDQLAPGEYPVTLKVGGLVSNGGVISVGKKVSE